MVSYMSNQYLPVHFSWTCDVNLTDSLDIMTMTSIIDRIHEKDSREPSEKSTSNRY